MAATQDQKPKLKFQRRRQPVQFFVEQLSQDIGIEMILIPVGTFMMGSPKDELERLDWEDPQHEVNVSGFFMGKHPVTQAQWRVVAAMPQINRELKADLSTFMGAKRPVETVPWYDAMEFCHRLSKFTERSYRLPSEAEWEYACRAGNTTPFHFGETITTDLANYDGRDSYGRGPKGEHRNETTPVDHFGIANEFGLCDMHGNVWEWCQDHWHENYEEAPNDGSAWLSANDNALRVIRGGSWDNNPRNCRSASRYSILPDRRDNNIGFRVVCSALRTP